MVPDRLVIQYKVVSRRREACEKATNGYIYQNCYAVLMSTDSIKVLTQSVMFVSSRYQKMLYMVVSTLIHVNGLMGFSLTFFESKFSCTQKTKF